MNEIDVAVIGGGAAGLSAALVLARALRTVVVIDGGRPRNAPAAQLHGFLTRDGLAPSELLRLGRDEVTSYGGQVIEAQVADLARHDRGFVVTLDDGSTLLARRVLVATGLTDEIPSVNGLAQRWGRDVLHCPYCHGHEVQGRPLGVIGESEAAIEHALLIRQWSPDVVYFSDGEEFSDVRREQLVARAIGVVDGPVAAVEVECVQLVGVRMVDGRFVPRAAVFVRPSFVPNTALLNDLDVETDPQGWPVLDATGRTNVSGLWVAGNAANPRAQLITAAGEGSAAAIAINNDLVLEDTQNAVLDYRAGLPA